MGKKNVDPRAPVEPPSMSGILPLNDVNPRSSLGRCREPALGASWVVFGASWALLGASWDRLGRLVGRLGRLLGRLVGLLGRLGRLLGRLGAVLGRLGAVLGCSGTLPGRSGSAFRPIGVTKIIDFPVVLVQFL